MKKNKNLVVHLVYVVAIILIAMFFICREQYIQKLHIQNLASFNVYKESKESDIVMKHPREDWYCMNYILLYLTLGKEFQYVAQRVATKCNDLIDSNIVLSMIAYRNGDKQKASEKINLAGRNLEREKENLIKTTEGDRILEPAEEREYYYKIMFDPLVMHMDLHSFKDAFREKGKFFPLDKATWSVYDIYGKYYAEAMLEMVLSDINEFHGFGNKSEVIAKSICESISCRVGQIYVIDSLFPVPKEVYRLCPEVPLSPSTENAMNLNCIAAYVPLRRSESDEKP
jgi:hypothetical protein